MYQQNELYSTRWETIAVNTSDGLPVMGTESRTTTATNSTGKVLAILNNLPQNFVFTVDLETSERIILLSRVDQAICTEAEAGKIHGIGHFKNGNWVNLRSAVTMQLDCYDNNPFQERSLFAINKFPGDMPAISSSLEPCCGRPYLPFPFLAMSLPEEGYVVRDYFGVSSVEMQHAKDLACRFGLDGKWSSRNRHSNTANWIENQSALSTETDSKWFKIIVNNSKGENLYVVEMCIQNNNSVLFLPVQNLKRANIQCDRRVFFPPEKNIHPICSGYWNGFLAVLSLSYCPAFSFNILPVNGFSYSLDQRQDENCFLWACFPGGAASVKGSDLSSLTSKVLVVHFSQMQGKDGIEFAAAMAARLTKEGKEFILLTDKAGKWVEVSMSDFRSIIIKNGLYVPEELAVGYGGELTEMLSNRIKTVVPGNLDAGEVIAFLGPETLINQIGVYIAQNLHNGCWNNFWQPIKSEKNIALFINYGDLRRVTIPKERVLFNLFDGSFSRLSEDAKRHQFCRNVQKTDIVVIASTDFLSDSKTCYACLNYCIQKNIAVILVGNERSIDLKIKSLLSSIYKTHSTQSGTVHSFAVVNEDRSLAQNVCLSDDGSAILQNLNETEIEQFFPVETNPAEKFSTDQVQNSIDLNQMMSEIEK